MLGSAGCRSPITLASGCQTKAFTRWMIANMTALAPREAELRWPALCARAAKDDMSKARVRGVAVGLGAGGRPSVSNDLG
jgi:hypothetical protein